MLKSLAGKARALAAVRRTIPINRSYHYRGFRYGGFGNNPYEDYILGLARGESIARLRGTFAHVVLKCRPRTFGEALQLQISDHAPWTYPWTPREQPLPVVGDPAQNPDIVCHYCERGVLASHVNREFVWLESAFESISRQGYLPAIHGYITCLELVSDGMSSFLVLDGNHRISALYAIGVREAEIKRPFASRIYRDDVHRWPGVRRGNYTVAEALKIFDRYFSDVNPPLAELWPARLIADETPLWAVS